MRAGIDIERDYFGLIQSAKATLKRINAYRASLEK